MITAFRRYLSTWVVRAFFLLLVLAFGLWGVGDVVRQRGAPETWVAKVGDTTIEPQQAQAAFQQQLAAVQRRLGDRTELSPDIRRSIAAQSLDREIARVLLADETRRLRIAAPDDAVVQAIYAIPGFHGANGQFDRRLFEQVLRNNGLNEQRFLGIVRADLRQRQLVEALRAGATPPETLTRAVFAYQGEKRAADWVELPFAAAPAPAEPDEATLRRWWENHPEAYTNPERRRIKVVVLSPQTLAKDIAISDDELRAAYAARRSDYVTPERRSAEIVSMPDEAKARELATAWRGGLDWAAVQRRAQEGGGSAVRLDDATQPEFPSAELGQAVFAAAPEAVAEPVRGPLGWNVIRVVKVVPATDRGFDQVKDELRERVLAEKATDLIYDRANKVDTVLGGGASLDQLPTDLGLGAVTGTLDAQGHTAEGAPVPIPGPPELKAAVVAAAFEARKGDPPRLTEVRAPGGGASSYYALEVEDVIPAARKPFDEVREQVKEDWRRDAVRKEQEQAAAQLLSRVKEGRSLADAAAPAGLTVRRSALTGRDEPAEGVPAQLLGPLFAARQGEPTMAETPDGFVVAVPAVVEAPDPKADPIGYRRIRDALGLALGNDVELLLVQALRAREPPRINQTALDGIVQP